MTPYASVIRAASSQIWAVQEDKLHAIMAFLQFKAQGLNAEASAIAKYHGEAQVVAARASKVTDSGGGQVAVMPLYGLILHRGSAMDDMCGPTATSTNRFRKQINQAAADDSIKAIIIDVDSPGGTVEGVDELWSSIREATKKKPVVAVVNCQCASAAYYIASACSEIVASPSSQTGSIGVYCTHEDVSVWLEKTGIKVTLVKFGENKAEGNPYQPLPDTAREHMQQMVDEYGNKFEARVAKGRGKTQAKVHSTFGQGMMFSADKALEIGMVDSIGTLDDVLARYGVSATSPSTSMGAAGSAPQMSARADDDVPPCTCDCPECVAGNCDDCTHEGCDCDGCDCTMSAEALADKQKAAQLAADHRELLIAGV